MSAHAHSHALRTAEELLRLNLPNKRTELVRGVLVVREPAGYEHGYVAMSLAAAIFAHVEAHDLGRVASPSSRRISR